MRWALFARADARLPRELVAVWLLFGAVAAEILVTYARLPARELYHVSGSGLTGGASRVLVFSNYPTALVAIAVLALLADQLSGGVPVAAAIIGSALCAAVFWPGVVDQANLDAKWVNALAAVGVLVALALTAWRLGSGTAWSPARPGDGIRLGVAAVALFGALPWLAADLGFFLNGVPGLDRLFQTGVYSPPAVHHGHHHGTDGVLLLLSALLLSRVVPSMRHHGLRVAVGGYLALMASYAIGNSANDFWTEQVVKRGWTTWSIPDVLRPKITIAWGVIVLGAAAIYGLSVWWTRSRTGVRHLHGV